MFFIIIVHLFFILFRAFVHFKKKSSFLLPTRPKDCPLFVWLAWLDLLCVAPHLISSCTSLSAWFLRPHACLSICLSPVTFLHKGKSTEGHKYFSALRVRAQQGKVSLPSLLPSSSLSLPPPHCPSHLLPLYFLHPSPRSLSLLPSLPSPSSYLHPPSSLSLLPLPPCSILPPPPSTFNPSPPYPS